MLGAFLFYCRGGLDVEAVAPVPAAAMATAVAASPCSRTGTVTSVMTEVRICRQNPEGPKVEVQEIWNERARA